MDWFEELTGFEECGYAEIQRRLAVNGNRLYSTMNGRSWAIGSLETPTLAELRDRALAGAPTKGRLKINTIASDAKQLHAQASSKGALFQVASQFNLLEMMHYSVSPEDGVTRYEYDPTQGPACAVAAGAATIYRNYFAPVANQSGQTNQRQINTLADLAAALGEGLIEMRNGYALCSDRQLLKINAHLNGLNETGLAALRDRLRIGLHWDVEVTTAGESQGQLLSQAFCSAMPVAYSPVREASWESFARLVLEAAYEATLWAAVLNAQRGQSKDVYLTMLGGGAFGNRPEWILQAMERALEQVAEHDLSVILVSYGHISPAFRALAERYAPTQMQAE